MALLNLKRIGVGEVGVLPGTIKMVSTDSLATVIAPGYLNGIGNQLTSRNISPSDVIDGFYAYNAATGVGTYGQFKVNISPSNGLITLVDLTPSSVIRFAAKYTTIGGAAAEAITVTGAVAATDLPFVQLIDGGTNTVSVVKAVITANTLTVTFSGNPSNNAVISYQILRPVV